MPAVLITGGTGTIGKRLTQLLLENKYEVIILSRSKRPSNNDNKSSAIKYAYWNIDTNEIDVSAISKADYIIHLAGAGVADKRWTKKRKNEIVESRTKSSALLIKALGENANKVKAIISASAIGWYGQSPTQTLSKGEGFTEDAKPSNDFLGETCRLWEESIEPVTSLNKRLVKLRTGIVLSNKGGAYVEFKKPLKAGVAAILGSGKQIISWIHEEDICRMYIYALENENLHGNYNAVAPRPLSNKALTLQIAKQLRGSFFIPVYVPAFVLKIMLGEMSIEVVKSATVSCTKIKEAGFTFLYPSIEAALQELATAN